MMLAFAVLGEPHVPCKLKLNPHIKARLGMVPKKQKGELRMVASMLSGWRRETKLSAVQERAWNKKVAGKDDVGRPGSWCLRAMEDRQILLDILKAC